MKKAVNIYLSIVSILVFSVVLRVYDLFGNILHGVRLGVEEHIMFIQSV